MRVAPCLLAALVLSAAAEPVDWPRFRGPNGSGIAEGAALPESLAAEHRAWSVEVPGGASSPALTGDRIFLTAYEGDDLLTLALDRESGKILWRNRRFLRPAPTDNKITPPTQVQHDAQVYQDSATAKRLQRDASKFQDPKTPPPRRSKRVKFTPKRLMYHA